MSLSTAATANAMDLVAMLAIDQIAAERNEAPTSVVTEFLASDTAAHLYDDSLKLWWDGPSAVVELFKEESGGLRAVSPEGTV